MLHRIVGHEAILLSGGPEYARQHVADFVDGLIRKLGVREPREEGLNLRHPEIGKGEIAEGGSR